MKFAPLLTIENKQDKKHIIALFGGGGKTSILYRLGYELSQNYTKVLLTSIVKAGPSPHFPIHFINPSYTIQNLFVKNNPLYIMKEKIRDDKYIGFKSEELLPWLDDIDVCIFECDGSRNLPLKTHSEWDPVVPDFTTQVIIVIGADVINTKLINGKVHRPEFFKSLWGIKDDTVIDIPLITKVVTDKKGYLSKIPNGIKTVYFVNKANTFQKNARNLALSIKSESSASVYYGSVREKWWKRVN